jgi:rod shape-determining protein MreC
VPRRGPRGSSPRDPGVTVRRLVAAALVVVSLALLTVYLRESDDGALHAAQRLGQAALHPFQVAGERIARPFQDAWSWSSDLVDAKSERDELAERVQVLQQDVVRYQSEAQENERLRELLGFVEGSRLDAYDRVPTRVIAQPASPYEQTVVIAAGSGDGVRVDDPVVTPDGLVGIVSKTSPNAAQVALLTDQSVAVSAVDATTNARGVLRRAPGAGSGLLLDRVATDLVIREGDVVITSGWREGELQSLYPRGIPIGRVTSVGLQDIDLYQRIQVTPFVDFGSLSEVVVLVGGERP